MQKAPTRLALYNLPANTQFWTKRFDFVLQHCERDANGYFNGNVVMEGEFCVVVTKGSHSLPEAFPDKPGLLNLWQTQPCSFKSKVPHRLTHWLDLHCLDEGSDLVQLFFLGADNVERTGFFTVSKRKG